MPHPQYRPLSQSAGSPSSPLGLSDSSSHGLLNNGNGEDSHSSSSSSSSTMMSSITACFEEPTQDLQRRRIPSFEPSRSLSYSRLFFTWFDPLINKCKSGGKITKEDLLEMPDDFLSERIYKKLIACWTYEDLKRNINSGGGNGYNHVNSEGGRTKLWKALHSLIFWEFWFCGLCRFANDASVLLGTILIKRIVSAAQAQDSRSTFFYALGILLNSAFQSIMLQQFIQGSFNCGSRVVSATTAAIYHATLAMRMQKINPPRTLGEINNIQSKDSNSLRDVVVFFHNLWACPLMIVACVLL